MKGLILKLNGEDMAKISDGTGIFAKQLEKPRVAICPKCGEISLYIENADKMDKRIFGFVAGTDGLFAQSAVSGAHDFLIMFLYFAKQI